MTTFNRPALMELGVLGNQMFIQRKRSAVRSFRIYYLKEISGASFRRLMHFFEARHWTDVNGDQHEWKVLGRIGVNTSTHINDYGVEVTDEFDIPRCCLSCPVFEEPEYGYDDQLWAAPFCMNNVKMPRRKGNCQTKARYVGRRSFLSKGVFP